MKISTRIVHKEGYGPSGRIKFQATSPSPINSRQARQEQTRLGYDPRGYDGPFCFHCEKGKDGLYLASWSCAASCD